jgi:hypothetical protein
MEPLKGDKQVGKQVWMACRAAPPCGGNQAVIKMRFPLPAGGISIRYQCQNCKKNFHTSI